MEPKEALNRGLEIYRDDMRALISGKLQAEFGEKWCSEQVAPLFPRGKRKLIIANLTAGHPPQEQVDVNEFGKVVEAFSELFPEGIREGEHHNRFKDITPARNAWGHGLGRLGKSPHRADAEAVLGACIDVLRQCELITSALALEDLVRQLEPPRHGLAASTTITDVPEYPVDEPLPPSSSETSATDVVVEF